MQIIIFKKTGSETTPFSANDWEEEYINIHFKESFKQGTILLIKNTDYPVLESQADLAQLFNCSIKKPKVELFRGLKFNLTQSRNLPRRIIANYSSLSAFKRSFFRFLNDHYKAEDPPCLLCIPDERIDELIKLTYRQPQKIQNPDPISLLMSGIPQGDKIDKISQVYIGESITSKITRSMIYKAAHSMLPVLILGESGTGKELIARQVYENSENHKMILSTVNCSSIPDSLFESELFGYMKDSFTGANENKEGLFKAANGGTLFLDEIGDLSPQNQAKLLRAIEEKEVRPLGSNKTIKVDVRIIAATNRNLAAMMKQKTFREDLYFRLNSIIIFAPPLREHPDDIPIIASAIWAKLDKPGKLSHEFLDYLKAYSWPGNVRELKTLLQTIRDLFEGVSPGPEHIESIRSYQKKNLIESKTYGDDDFHHFLKEQSRSRILEVQIILRDIKIVMRPIINNQSSSLSSKIQKEIKEDVLQKLDKIENLCREPIFFRNRILFDKIKRLRYLIDKSMKYMPDSSGDLMKIWKTDLDPLYVKIDDEIFPLIWGKMDL